VCFTQVLSFQPHMKRTCVSTTLRQPWRAYQHQRLQNWPSASLSRHYTGNIVHEYWPKTTKWITWTNVLQNRCGMCI